MNYYGGGRGWLYLIFFLKRKRPTWFDDLLMTVGLVGCLTMIGGTVIAQSMMLAVGQRRKLSLVIVSSLVAYLVCALVMAVRASAENSGTNASRQLLHIVKMVGLYMLLPIILLAIFLVLVVMPHVQDPSVAP
jgi:hypothetical protein